MFAYSSLQDLIDLLESGSRCHISVLFLAPLYKNSKLALKQPNIIHATPFCDAMKRRPKGQARCMKCKQMAVDKALRTRQPFGGLCINGVYEYCRPVVENDSVVCIVFVGNVVTDADAFHARSAAPELLPLRDTMEYAATAERYQKMAELLESYIHMLLAVSPVQEDAQAMNPAVEMLKGYADSHFFDAASLEQIAGIYHYNSKYLGRLFKKELGMTFKSYLNHKRLENARMLLREEAMSVTDVALRAGFNNVTYFNRVFYKAFGRTPTQYRKEK